MEKVLELYIKTIRGLLWHVITDREIGSTFRLGSQATSDLAPGSRFEQRSA